MGAGKPYPDVDPQPDFPALERERIELWRREKIFERSVDQRPAGEEGENEFVFYDGPPFANGLPHYGHLLTGYVKDIVPRYQTLRGRRVERRFGWDCHGLPAEMETERELGISGRAKIEEYGVERFNAACRSSVMQYTEQWVEYVTRQARWVDFRHDYKTMDAPYMESVVWAFHELYEKGLIYEGYKVVAYSWAAETPVSNFETRLDDAYRPRQDPAVTVRFALDPAGHAPLELWVWTTTPWTLPSNLALAVGPSIEYAVFDVGGRRVALGAATVENYARELEGAARLGTLRGSELAGRTYQPLFPFFAGQPDAFRVLPAGFVDTEEGTGVVHLAPGFGEDDMEVCAEAGIGVVCPVDDSGNFSHEVSTYAGQNVFDANAPIVRELRERELLVRHETYVHNYPHCWRTDTPLIYKAVSSWFLRASALRERMVELNREIRWVPEHVRDGLFGKWLEGARDWPISRSRFWGSPIPVWKSDDPAHPRIDVYGSIAALERDFGVPVTDLHRPAIDQLTRPNPDDPSGKSRMLRVPEVFDCWFESGSMPYAQVHYPFENRDWFENHFPADFITEYVAQTRGWFYTMMVLSTALFDKPPFLNCICHGVVLDEDAKKLSKRLRNYPTADEVFETYGSDALRWFFAASAIMRGQDLQIDREGQKIREIVRLVLNPIWNAYYFFCLYANSEGIQAELRTDPADALDRYILTKTRRLVEDLGESLDAYDLAGACAHVSAFLDVLNNWYIRRSRPRFWSHEAAAERAAYDTLYSVLVLTMRAVSPLLPLLAEEVYTGLTAQTSVHLTDWPDVSALPQEHALETDMDLVRDVCSTALALRRAHDVRVRQPLRSLTVAGADVARLAPFEALIRDEVNVKAVELRADVETYAAFTLQVNARNVGRRLGKRTQDVIRAAKAGEWRKLPDGRVEIVGETLEPDDFSAGVEPRPGITCHALASGDGIAILDLELSPELELEGKARDIVRVVQQARREAALHVSDPIRLRLALPDTWEEAATAHRDYIASQTLAVDVELGEAEGEGRFLYEGQVGSAAVRVGLVKAS